MAPGIHWWNFLYFSWVSRKALRLLLLYLFTVVLLLVFANSILLVIVQSFSRVLFIVTPWTAARQASLTFTISRSLLKFMSIESVMLLGVSS